MNTGKMHGRAWTATLALALGAWAWAMPAPAQVRIVKTAGEKTAIDVTGLATAPQGPGALFLNVLKNDLRRSGWFDLAGAGGGEYRVLGNAEMQGSRLIVQLQLAQVAAQRIRMSRSYGAPGPDVRALAHKVADDIVAEVTGCKGIAATKIVMVGNRTGSKELYLCDADGEDLRQMTRDNSVSLFPSWSPDGRSIYYTSFLKKFPDVWTVDITTGERRKVAAYPGLNTGSAISPDGRMVALILSKDGNPELYVKNLAGGEPTRLTRTPGAEASPTWSPDGQSIAYVSDQSGRPHVYVISRQGGAPRRLTSRGAESVAPDWGPNNKIAYASLEGRSYTICIVDPANGEVAALPIADGGSYEDPSWAPDGRHLACMRTQGYASKVIVLDTVTSDWIPLTDAQGDWSSPAWSPQ